MCEFERTALCCSACFLSGLMMPDAVLCQNTGFYGDSQHKSLQWSASAATGDGCRSTQVAIGAANFTISMPIKEMLI